MLGPKRTLTMSGALAVAAAQTLPNITSYPTLNVTDANLNAIFSATGAPGIYNTSYTPDSEYGIYNWCDMPHVRKQEYVVPPSNYTLKYVEIIQRHHKRTPYASNIFFKEDISWNCSKAGPVASLASGSNYNAYQIDPMNVFWQGMVNSKNPFEYTVGPGYPNSTCQFPALTSQGLDDSYQHGQDLKGVYGDLLDFLPQGNQTDLYRMRVTNNVITTQTASGLAIGLWPNVTRHYALVQSSDYDSLEPTFSCGLYSSLKAKSQSSASTPWVEHLQRSLPLRYQLNNVSGISLDDTGGWNSSYDHYYDNLSAQQCHQLPLPCSVNNTAVCVNQTQADQVYWLGQFEYAWTWRNAPNATLTSALEMGPWFTELRYHIDQSLNGTSPVKYWHNFAHDGSVSPVLGILQIDKMVWPGMGSEVSFEIWQANSQPYVRVLWGGQVMNTSLPAPLNSLNMIPLQTFYSYLDSVIPSDLVGACNLS